MRVRSNKPGRYWRDKGHYSRKAVLVTYAVLTLPVYLIHLGLDGFERFVYEPVVRRGHKIHVWSHPCLYARKDS